MFCRTCWTNLPDNAAVCARCGADPQKDPAADPAALKPPDASRQPSTPRIKPPLKAPAPPKKSVGATSVIAFLVAAGAAFYYFGYARQGEEPKESAAVVAEVLPKDSSAVVLEPVAALPKLEIAESAGEVAPDELKAAVDAYNAGDFATAAELFRKLSIEAHDDERAKTKMRTNLARSLASMALAHYNNGDFNKSKSLYEEAIGYFREPDFIKGLAAAQIKLDDREGAVKSLESIEPDAFVKTALFDLYSMLGVKAKADGRVDEAVRNLEKALEIKPQSAELRTALSALKRETHAESGFRSKEGGHFVVKYDAVENAVAGHVISILLEEAYMRVGADLGFYPDDAITAVLYGAEQFRDVTRSPAWAGALYDGRIKVPAGGITEKTDLLEKVLIHEYTHAVVHRAALGRAPVWLNEGIAQYEEGKRTVSDAAALRGLASGNVTLRQLEGSFMRLGAREAEAAYLLSLSAVEYLMDEFGGSSVKRIMDGLKAGKNLDDAIHDATYLSYGDFNEAWLNSIKR